MAKAGLDKISDQIETYLSSSDDIFAKQEQNFSEFKSRLLEEVKETITTVLVGNKLISDTSAQETPMFNEVIGK